MKLIFLRLNAMRTAIFSPGKLGYRTCWTYPLIPSIHKEKEKKQQKKKEKGLLLSSSKRGHFYLGKKGTFLSGVDTYNQCNVTPE